MSKIRRSPTNVTGNLTVTQGDVKIETPDAGIILTDTAGDQSKVKVVDDNGVKTLEIEEIP